MTTITLLLQVFRCLNSDDYINVFVIYPTISTGFEYKFSNLCQQL